MVTITVTQASRIMRLMQATDNDFVSGISGARGLGKSTLMCWLTKELFGDWYDFEQYHIYQRNELEKNLKNLPDKSVVNADEAITSLFKREWHDNKQIEIVKLLNMFRDKCDIINLLIPHFWDMDTAVRNSLIIKWWVYIYKLGEAIIFTHDTNPFSMDPWNIKHNLYLWGKGQIYKSPNYLFNIRWHEMPEPIYLRYKKVKAMKRVKANKAEAKEEQKLPTKSELAVLIKRVNSEATGNKIAELLKVNDTLVYRQWKKNKL